MNRLEPGDGFWKTAFARGSDNHYFADSVTGQAAWMGTMKEKGGTLLMALRTRVQTGRLIEIESAFFRAGGGGPNNIGAMDTSNFAGRASNIGVTEAFRIEGNKIRGRCGCRTEEPGSQTGKRGNGDERG